MTVIAGLLHEGKVWMGGDSAAVGPGWAMQSRIEPKVFKVGRLLIGCCGSFRMMNLLRYEFHPPDHDPRHNGLTYMVKTVIPAVKQCFQAGGFNEKVRDSDMGGVFLVGYKGKLYHVDCDYQVGVPRDNIDAIGCGGDLALGALSAASQSDPRARVLSALKAAARFSAGVRAPFTVRSL